MKPKQFNPEATLQVIADTFARGGYEGTSLDDLTRRTGLGKQSLYNAFGDKKAMLTKAVAGYGKSSALAAALENTALNGRGRIDRFFEVVLADAQEPSNPGCLITNLLLEKGGSDVEVLRAASAQWNVTREKLQQAAAAGQRDGSIPKKLDAETLSYALMNILNGLRVTVRVTSDMAKVKAVLKAQLGGLL